VARAAAWLVVAPFLTFTAALAPQHVHEPGPGHEHEHAVAHSHFAPHHLETHDHLDLAEAPELDHGDESIVWLDSSTLHESLYKTAPIPPAIPISFALVPVVEHWSVTPFDDAAPVHGPPRPASPFRGPPPRRLS
jgi:hypothetical protein